MYGLKPVPFKLKPVPFKLTHDRKRGIPRSQGPDPLQSFCMRGWSIPLGRWMGVEGRVHLFFSLLAIVCLGLSGSDGVWRGLGLFLALAAAVAVRETARLLVAAWM